MKGRNEEKEEINAGITAPLKEEGRKETRTSQTAVGDPERQRSCQLGRHSRREGGKYLFVYCLCMPVS